MRKRQFFIQNFDAGDYLENLLITAVITVLSVRLMLSLTGYPQIGGHGLHIAHLLWGGLLMLTSIILLLSFLGNSVRPIAAAVAGAGFGLFIDEVGKFVTADVNYFFRPAVAIIYVTFALLFLVTRRITRQRPRSSAEYLANALKGIEEFAHRGNMDEERREQVLQYLKKGTPSHMDIRPLEEFVMSIEPAPPLAPPLFSRLKASARGLYNRLGHSAAFTHGVAVFFALDALIRSAYILILTFEVGIREERSGSGATLQLLSKGIKDLSVVDWIELPSLLLSVIFVLSGIWVLTVRRSRLHALRMFERSLLVSIYITQVFIFYKDQFYALIGLLFHVVVLAALRFMIEQERSVPVRQEVWREAA
jgi:hypothetical protein